jgi:hypothetical protein
MHRLGTTEKVELCSLRPREQSDCNGKWPLGGSIFIKSPHIVYITIKGNQKYFTHNLQLDYVKIFTLGHTNIDLYRSKFVLYRL